LILDATTYPYLDCNETALKVYGYSRDEPLKMTPFDLRPPECHDGLRQGLAKLAADGTAPGTPGSRVFSTTTHLTKSGRRMDVEILADRMEYDGRTALRAT
jgi:PAS domain S-box-containing protein